MEKELGVVEEVLKFAVQTDDIALIINKTLNLLEHSTQANLACFYWNFNKNFYTYARDGKDENVCRELKEASVHCQPEDLVLRHVVKEVHALPGFKAVYFPVHFTKTVVGVVSLVFLSDDEKQVMGQLNFIWTLTHQLALSAMHTMCQYAMKRNRHEAISGMIGVIEALDPYTRDHAKNVSNYALLLAEELKLPPHAIEEVYYGALFHDIGKVGIPVTILRKSGALTAEEYELIKDHPRKGAKILEKFHDFKALVPIVLHHHEMYGGGGYPDGIVGDHIPFNARLVAVVDAYDAITTNRSYRKAQGCKTAIDLIIKNTPKQFDPDIVKAFINVEKNL